MFARRKKEKEVLGIHVGREAMTVLRVARNNGTTEVRQVFRRLLPRAPSAWPADAVRQGLRQAKRQMSLKSDDTRLTLSDDLAPGHFLMMPKVKGKQLHSAVKLELENRLGDPAGELCFDCEVLEKRGDRCRVFAPCIPMERLRVVLHSFLDVNCLVDVMEVEAASLVNTLTYCRLAKGAPVAALHVGRTGSEMYVVRNRKIALARFIPRSEHPADDGPVTEDAAETAPHLDADYAGRIVTEANRTLDYFEIELLSPPVQQLLLFGPEAESENLSSYLARELEIEVTVLDTEGRVTDVSGEFDPTLHAFALGATLGKEETA